MVCGIATAKKIDKLQRLEGVCAKSLLGRRSIHKESAVGRQDSNSSPHDDGAAD